MSDRVFVIGAGKVGRGLSRAFRASGVVLTGLHARRPSDEATSSGVYPAALGDANVIVIAVRDEEIDAVCESLAHLERREVGRIAHAAVVLHTSGTAEPPAFAALRVLGVSAGTFHPLVPFATAGRGAQLLRGAWVGIDGDANACAAARRLAAAVGARTVNIPAGGKAAYHAAAVMASNFPVVLADLAIRLLEKRGVPQRTAEQVVQSLMAATVKNLDHGSPADVLTGPVVRGDSATIEAHRLALQEDVDALMVYELLTRVARTMVKRS